LNVLDRHLVERVAADLLTSPGLVEKDWHVTRAIAVLAGCDHGAAVPAFGGGTSLSKGWGLIKRFSEDIDFKVSMPAAVSRNRAKNDRSGYRKRILAALTEAGFVLASEPTRADENHFFSADLFYPSLFAGSVANFPGRHARCEDADGFIPPTNRIAEPDTFRLSCATGLCGSCA
jgi:hypothetical protein